MNAATQIRVMRHECCPITELMIQRYRAGWLAAGFIVTSGVGLIASQLPPHSRPPGVRMAPAPPGEGGGLSIRAPRDLCVNDDFELHLHYFPEPGTTRYVLEAPAGPSPCEWEINDLPEGTYEVLIQVAPDGRVTAKADAKVEKGVTTSISLHPLVVEIEGYVISRGLSPKDLTLMFGLPDPRMVPYAGAINEDGWYNVKLGGHDERYCARLTSKQGGNSLSKCAEFHPGLQRFDLEVAPGVIQVSVSPIRTVPDSMWAQVHLRALRTEQPADDVLRTNGGGVSFKASDGFRGHYIGVAYGEFVLGLSVGNMPVNASRVTLSATDPMAAVTLSAPPEQ